MSHEFEELAEGNFDSGLARLNKDNRWHDGSDDLDGPFCLSFPGAKGWGEELLAASLLKRHAAKLAHGNGIKVFAHQKVCSILRNDNAFCVKCNQGSQKLRSPLAILRQALTGNLLHEQFVPLSTPAGSPQTDRTRLPRIGIAWASISNGKCIKEKSIPIHKFRSIITGVDAQLISFQRNLQVAGTEITEIADVVVKDEVIDAGDQTEVVQEILGLDCMITISTTTAHIAASFGIDVILLAAKRQGHQWFWQAQANHERCLYPTVQVLIGEGEGVNWWHSCLERAKTKLSNLLAG